jgi:hypothetical protein
MELPIIIAGPILRRVEPNSVSVWLACTRELNLTLKLYEGSEVGVNANPGGFSTTSALEVPTSSSTAKTHRFGARLWIGVVTARPNLPLQSSRLYSYNIHFQSADGSVKGDFHSESLLKKGTYHEREQLAIGYGNDKLPSFALSSEDPTKYFVAQTSCRKMHGHGLDALSHLDKIIEDNIKDFDKRPQQLFLTGDQVYADDVPGSILRHIAAVDGIGIGLHETVRVDRPKDGTVADVEVDITTWPPYLRQGLMTDIAGFTSTAASSHVISFSEYARLYLCYWSNRAWNIDLVREVKKVQDDNSNAVLAEAVASLLDSTDTDDDPNLKGIYEQARSRGGADFDMALTAGQRGAFIPAAGSSADTQAQKDKFDAWLEEIRGKLAGELKELAVFAAALPKVSRVLANVPSYMIFDDHEVTDDWYISRRWNNRVLSKNLGRDTIRNAMMAYAVFQDWGNVPDEYVPEPQAGESTASLKPRTKLLRKIIEYSQTLASAPASPIPRPAAVADIEALIGLGTEPPEVKWHYQVRTRPTTAYVLDTRTRRQYDSLNSPPGLLTQEALDEQLPTLNPAGAAVPFTIVVSPAPAPGLASFEELVQPAAAAIVGLGGGTPENPGVIEGMMKFDFEAWGFNVGAFEALLERLSKHKKVIVFSGDVHYGFSSVLDYWKGTSSTPVARIMTFTSSAAKNEEYGVMYMYRCAMVQKLLAGLSDNIEKLGWKDRVLSISGPASIMNRQRLRRNPAVIPVSGWVPGSQINQPPDYRYRIRILTDESLRTDDPVTADLDLGDATSTAVGYEKVTSRHQEIFVSGVHRRMIWPANVGLLRFEGTGSDLIVKHDYLFTPGSRDLTAKTPPGPYIKHQSRLVASSTEATRPELP